MARRKYPSDLNTRLVRVNVGDYLLLTELSHKLNVTMAEALSLAITDRATQESDFIKARLYKPMPSQSDVN